MDPAQLLASFKVNHQSQQSSTPLNRTQQHHHPHDNPHSLPTASIPELPGAHGPGPARLLDAAAS